MESKRETQRKQTGGERTETEATTMTVTEVTETQESLKRKKAATTPKKRSKASRKEKKKEDETMPVDAKVAISPPPTKEAPKTPPAEKPAEETQPPVLLEEENMPVLDRTETVRLISELEAADRQKIEIEHDPWLPLEVLMARSKDFYSMKRAVKNSAITYEKLGEYEFASTKEGGNANQSDKNLNVKINSRIDREHFDVQTRAKLKNDVTEVIDHEPGSANRPEGT
uniref:Uncharacterized protein n=1 Tax=Panagrolaimus sp. JU765 TaxID=591449 RepID=A0AC34QD81_9BILA